MQRLNIDWKVKILKDIINRFVINYYKKMVSQNDKYDEYSIELSIYNYQMYQNLWFYYVYIFDILKNIITQFYNYSFLSYAFFQDVLRYFKVDIKHIF